jgi:hypothetical protein
VAQPTPVAVAVEQVGHQLLLVVLADQVSLFLATQTLYQLQLALV